MNTLAERLIGLAIAVATGAALWALWTFYADVARLQRWTGMDSLRPLGGWLMEMRLPVIAVLATLLLTLINWLVERLRLGH